MDNKMMIDGNSYTKLGAMKINNREYILAIKTAIEVTPNENGSHIYTIEQDNGNYSVSSENLSLDGNGGGSLVRLNERILMRYIAKKLKDSVRDGSFKNPQDIKNYFSKMENEVNNDMELKKLLRGNDIVKYIDTDLFVSKFNENAKNILQYYNRQDEKKVDVSKIESFNVENNSYIERKNNDGDIEILEDMTTKFDPNQFRTMGVKSSETSTNGMENKVSEDFDLMKKYDKVEVPTDAIRQEAKDEVVLNTPIVMENPASVKNVETIKTENVETNVEMHTPSRMSRNIGNETKVEESVLPNGVKESDLTEEMITVILDKRKDNLTPKQKFYLQSLLVKKENERKGLNKEMVSEGNSLTKEEKPKTLVLKKKDAAYVDTVIMCLVVQLGLFALLVLVLLLIK